VNYGMEPDQFTMRLSLKDGGNRMSGTLRYDYTSNISVNGRVEWSENWVEASR
jgi:hypothetical protein